MSGNIHFAITDTETTGLFPGRGDRIVEIALVRVDSSGQVLDEYSTLLNPERDIGATHIHGLTARDVKHAPVFGEVAGDVLSVLSGTVFVAHNVHFDMRFLRAEMLRVGCELPTFPFVCTMQLARRADPSIPSRKLQDLCAHFGIPYGQGHSALSDARATAELFATCLARLDISGLRVVSGFGAGAELIGRESWPSLPVCGRTYDRGMAHRELERAPSYITHLVSKLPAGPSPSGVSDEYLCLLDTVLEDRRVTAEELEELIRCAAEVDLSQDQVVRMHEMYMRDLIWVALEDDVITEMERSDLDQVRRLLGISNVDYTRLFKDVAKMRARGCEGTEDAPNTSADLQGRTVCFTGTFRARVDGELATRAMAGRVAKERGMVVEPRVTKSLDYLVAVDAESMSGKARKARKYGVRILAEPVFWRMMGVQVQ